MPCGCAQSDRAGVPQLDDLATYFLTNDGGTTWYDVQHPGIRLATTNATGYYTFVIANPSEQLPNGTTWTVQYNDGSRIQDSHHRPWPIHSLSARERAGLDQLVSY